MARGAEAKSKITEQILKTFDQAFLYEKEIRIPVMENGELIQVKVTLTAAKTNVENGADTEVPSGTVASVPASSTSITEEEKNEVADLLASLNL